jgi:hypothetical protein
MDAAKSNPGSTIPILIRTKKMSQDGRAEPKYFKGGLDLKFFEQSAFETVDHKSPTAAASLARNALRLVMMGWTESWTQLLSWNTLKAAFIRRDPLLMREFRRAFQQGFLNLFNQLHGKVLNPDQHEQVQLYLSNCLSFLPVSDLTPYEFIKFPQNIEGQWALVEYQVKPIELTPRTGFKRFIIKDQDRVFAYGLEPINNKHAVPHLIFMATTYPAGQGFISQVSADLKGFESVGSSLYQAGKKQIETWLGEQKHKVHVCGMSLGGSLSFLTAVDLGKYIFRVDVLNPPGLHEPWYKKQKDKWEELLEKPLTVIQQQGNDPVSCFGTWKKEWRILNVTPPKEKQGPNPFWDHFLNYAGFADTKFSPRVPEEQNLKRTFRNFWIFSLGRGFVYYWAVVPFQYAIRPFLYLFYEFPAHVLGVILVLMSFILGRKMIDEPLYAHLHDPKLLRNEEMDIYNPANLINLDLTHKEFYTYYHVMRCLVKEKQFLPTVDKPLKHGQGSSKKALLLTLQNPDNSEILVNIKATKAKYIHIRNTLTLIGQLGVENEKQLKLAVENNYQQYCVGKPQ